MSLFSLFGALEIGLIFSLVALGVFISFRLLRFPDLTVDGSFPLGGAVCATLIALGLSLIHSANATADPDAAGARRGPRPYPRAAIPAILPDFLRIFPSHIQLWSPFAWTRLTSRTPSRLPGTRPGSPTTTSLRAAKASPTPS